MPGIWIYSEDAVVARQLLTAGLELKKTMQQPVNAITFHAEEASGLAAAGADKVVVLKGANSWPESYAASIADILAKEEASAVLVGATMRGKDAAAKIAAQLKAGLVTDALSVQYVNGSIETTRMMYGGLALRTDSVSLPALVAVPPRTFAEAADNGGQGAVETLEVANEDSRVAISNVCPIVREGADISAANRVVGVGRGLAKQEDLAIAQQLAAAAGAEIGCTRGISEDYHWLPNDRYIGISGQKIKPELYIAMGISGQVQHVAGIRDSKIIVAIDSNEKAPIFEAADYGIVGDLYEVAPLLAAALKK